MTEFNFTSANMILMVGGQVLFFYIITLLFLTSEQPLTSIVPKGLLGILSSTPTSKSANVTNASGK